MKGILIKLICIFGLGTSCKKEKITAKKVKTVDAK